MIDCNVESSTLPNQSESSSSVSAKTTNNTNKSLSSFDSKTYSIEDYEKRFQNSLKQLNAPKWFSMNVSSTLNSNSNQSNSNNKFSYTKKYDSFNDNNLKSITSSSSKTNTENPIISAHKLKYERIKQRYRLQQQQKQSKDINDDLLNKPQVKIRETNLNKSTRSLTNSIHYNTRIYDDDEDDENDKTNTNNNTSKPTKQENTYSKSAYSLNNDSQYLSSYSSTYNDLMKRSQSSYNNTNKSNNSILDSNDSTNMSSVKQRPLWLSYSALQNKSSSTIYSFTSTGSNWYKPKSLQLPTSLVKTQDSEQGKIYF